MEKKRNGSHGLLKYSVYIISLGGFLFGYDTGMVNGALAFMSKPDQLNLSPSRQGIVSSSLVLGACVGAFCCGRFADKYGRKNTLKWNAVLFTASTIFCAASVNFIMMSIFRFILGIAVGAASSLSPMYLAEISPKKFRASNVNKNAIFIVLGQLTAFIVNAILGTFWGSWQAIWRIMVLVACVPSIMLWINSFNITGSPHWLLQQGHFSRAKELFQKLGFKDRTVTRIINGYNSNKKTDKKSISWKQIFKHSNLIYLLIMGILVALIQQISGVNTVMYYGTILLEKVGMGQQGSLYANILIGLTSVIASILGTRLIAGHNHLTMLKIGLVGNAVFLALLSAVMHASFLSQSLTNAVVLIALILFLASHQGIVSPVTWLIMAEMFPGDVKARFVSISTATTWIANFLISLVYPVLIAVFGIGNVFLIFACANAGSLLLSILLINQKRLRQAYKQGLKTSKE